METKTIKDIKSNPEFVSGIELENFGVNAYILHQPDTDVLKYCAFLDGTLLVSNEFRPTPFHSIESLTVLCQVLEFVTYRPRKIGKRLVKKYSKAHLEFLDSEKCESIKTMLVNAADVKSKHHLTAKAYLEMCVCL